MIPAPKVIPVYFPQYHSIPENDRFWEKDFTGTTTIAATSDDSDEDDDRMVRMLLLSM